MRDNVLIYTQAISNLIPGIGFSIDNCDYSTLSVTEGDTPSEKNINKEYDRLLQEYNNEEYQRLRESEYPSLADFADAYYWAQKGDNTKMKEYVAKCDAVKNKYPKVNDAN